MIDELELLRELGRGQDAVPSHEARQRARRALDAEILVATAAETASEGAAEDTTARVLAVLPNGKHGNAPTADRRLADRRLADRQTGDRRLADRQTPDRRLGDPSGRRRRANRIAPTGRLRRWPVAAAAVAALAAGATLLATVVLPSGDPAGPAAAAAAVLDQAAQRALEAPPNPQPGPGQYLYLKTEDGHLTEGTTSAKSLRVRLLLTTSVIQVWIAPDGAGKVVAGPGSTRTVPSLPALSTLKTEPVSSAQGSVGPFAGKRTPLNPLAYDGLGNYTVQGGSSTFVDPAANLPTNPAALSKAIVRRYENGHAQAVLTFQLAGGFLQETTSPALRSALYRVVAGLPGVTSLGSVTDRLGRSGVGVALLSGGIRYELVFDPDTSAVLQSQQVAVDPPPLPPFPVRALNGGTSLELAPAPRYIPGTVLSYTVYESTGIVDSTSAVPRSR